MPVALRRQCARDQALWLLHKPLPLAELLSSFREKMMAGWAHERLRIAPDQFPSDSLHPGLHMCKYKHWMGLSFERAAPPMHPPHARSVMPFDSHRCLMRFRMCCWPLAANRNHNLPRSARLCPLCNNGVEDERHVLLARSTQILGPFMGYKLETCVK